MLHCVEHVSHVCDQIYINVIQLSLANRIDGRSDQQQHARNTPRLISPHKRFLFLYVLTQPLIYSAVQLAFMQCCTSPPSPFHETQKSSHTPHSHLLVPIAEKACLVLRRAVNVSLTASASESVEMRYH